MSGVLSSIVLLILRRSRRTLRDGQCAREDNELEEMARQDIQVGRAQTSGDLNEYRGCF